MRWFHTCIHFFRDDDDDDDDKDPGERERQQERAFKRKSLYIRGYNNNNNQLSIFESPIIHSVCAPHFARYCLQMLLGGLHIPYAHLIIFTCILRNINIKLLLLLLLLLLPLRSSIDLISSSPNHAISKITPKGNVIREYTEI